MDKVPPSDSRGDVPLDEEDEPLAEVESIAMHQAKKRSIQRPPPKPNECLTGATPPMLPSRRVRAVVRPWEERLRTKHHSELRTYASATAVFQRIEARVRQRRRWARYYQRGVLPEDGRVIVDEVMDPQIAGDEAAEVGY